MIPVDQVKLIEYRKDILCGREIEAAPKLLARTNQKQEVEVR